MTSPARVFAILDLFTRERPTWHADEINDALGYARATGYRYVRELVEAGFLAASSSWTTSCARATRCCWRLPR